jgi:hypothetical protein
MRFSEDVFIEDNLHQGNSFGLLRIRYSSINVRDVGLEIQLLLDWGSDKPIRLKSCHRSHDRIVEVFPIRRCSRMYEECG